MDQLSTNNSSTAERVKELKKEVFHLQSEVKKLEKQIADIQKTCQHAFVETASMRKCLKCYYAESIYY
ncbi:hypothetical protein [Bacillus sp. FJAT-47783]|uniref:hypothetical protein n=1 Tax=Bacillus sp. FJAT-47783 TaxID=2922712 RepID=UPI001FACAC09|nr:hypothetical protein [Bacillus sp. FJAT-47783]